MVSELMGKYSKVFIITIVLLGLLFLGLHLWAVNGESYKHSLGYIKNSKQVKKAIGEINNQYLPFLGKHRVTTNGRKGYAEFNIKVEGEKHKGIVNLILKQHEGKWKVVQGELKYGGNEVVALIGE